MTPNKPVSIYLQVNHPDGHEGVMWCEDKIHEDDVEYVRKDLTIAKSEVEELIDSLDSLPDMVHPKTGEDYKKMWKMAQNRIDHFYGRNKIVDGKYVPLGKEQG